MMQGFLAAMTSEDPKYFLPCFDYNFSFENNLSHTKYYVPFNFLF